MEREQRTGRRAAAARAASAAVTESTLAGFEKSPPAQHVMVKRVIHALRCAWSDISEREETIWDLQQQLTRLKDEKRPVDTAPAALLVVHCDGWCELFADEAVKVGALELRPWDSDDETAWKELLTGGKRFMFAHLLEGKCRLSAYPHRVGQVVLTDEALLRVIECCKRIELYEKAHELLALVSRRKPEA